MKKDDNSAIRIPFLKIIDAFYLILSAPTGDEKLLETVKLEEKSVAEIGEINETVGIEKLPNKGFSFFKDIPKASYGVN